MPWLAASLEGLDDEHPAAAARARVGERLRRIGLARLVGRGWGQVEEFTHGFHHFGAIGAGEQAVVADAVEAVWQYVDEEAAEHGPSNFTNQLTAIH